MDGQCLHCDAGLVAIEHDLCEHCRWVIRAEAEEGLYKLQQLLGHYTDFDSWCADHGLAVGC